MSTETLEVQDNYAIVRRTAQYGLLQAGISRLYFEKWLAVWALDIVCEANEISIEAQKVDSSVDSLMLEVGDVCWGIYAVALLCEIGDLQVNDFDYRIANLVHCAATVSDYLKKVARDSRIIDKDVIRDKLQNLLSSVNIMYSHLGGVNAAMRLVDAKLRKRYPDGYKAEQSINRVE
jgi:hypothetical protein